MNTSEATHMPHVWQCQDCNSYGNDSRKCWACASTVVWPVGKRVLGVALNTAVAA